MAKINFIKYEGDILDLTPGETIRVNHEDCPAGEDTRKRLYLTRPADNPAIVLGYCHNCQNHGTHKYFKEETFRPHKEVVFQEEPGTYAEPHIIETQCTDDVHAWGSHATAWRMNKGMRPDYCEELGIQWDYNQNAIYLPSYGSITIQKGRHPVRENYQGYQLRPLNEGASCKYVTYKTKKDTNFSTKIEVNKIGTRPTFNRTILVEDLCSGYKVARAWKKSGDWDNRTQVLVNYGTKVNLDLLGEAKGHRNYIWFDNDSQHVIDQAKKNANVLQMITGKITHVIDSGFKDPKTYPLATIKEIIKNTR